MSTREKKAIDATTFSPSGGEVDDPSRPVVAGLLEKPTATPLLDELLAESPSDERLETYIDGKRVVVEGRDEVVFRCGKASITLRQNGHVVIRGLYVESHATSVNRIKGGAVKIN